jgi:hypothetical protein
LSCGEPIFPSIHLHLLLPRGSFEPATTPAIPEPVKVEEASVDITITSENHIGRGRLSLGRSRFAGLAAGLCAIALLLGLGLRASSAENFGTSTKYETGTAAAGKSKYSRSALLATSARAEAEESNGLPPVAAPDNPKYGGRYFVDFRARTAASYGHAFLWYGRLKQDGKVGAIEVAGLHPATDSVVPYILGHIIPVPSETGKSYGDLDEQYLTASYRVYLTEAQARNVFAYIKQKQASSPIWQAGTVNCTGFISDVASYMGLRTPALPTLMYPEDLVKAIKELNGGRQEMPSYASAH